MTMKLLRDHILVTVACALISAGAAHATAASSDKPGRDPSLQSSSHSSGTTTAPAKPKLTAPTDVTPAPAVTPTSQGGSSSGTSAEPTTQGTTAGPVTVPTSQAGAAPTPTTSTGTIASPKSGTKNGRIDPCGNLPGCGTNPLPREALYPTAGSLPTNGWLDDSDTPCRCQKTDKCCLNASAAACWKGRPNNEACYDNGYKTNEQNKPGENQYRDSMYSQDYVADYLVQHSGLKKTLARDNAGNLPPYYFLKSVLPRYWYPYYSDWTPIKQLDFIRQGVVDIGQPKPYIINGKTVAVLTTDRYYRGHTGIVWLFDNKNPSSQCVYIRAKNWLKHQCQIFSPKNCYQSYDSFLPETPATNSKCIPISKVNFFFNYGEREGTVDADSLKVAELAKACDAAKPTFRDFKDASCKALCDSGYDSYCGPAELNKIEEDKVKPLIEACQAAKAAATSGQKNDQSSCGELCKRGYSTYCVTVDLTKPAQ